MQDLEHMRMMKLKYYQQLDLLFSDYNKLINHMNIFKLKLVVLFVLFIFLSVSQIMPGLFYICQKGSYPRIRNFNFPFCPANTTKIDNDCFQACPNGYTRAGTDCLQNCPSSDFKNQNLTCTKTNYSRNVVIYDGLPRTYAQCETTYGKGNCQLWNGIALPKCKIGYYPLGCCTCIPSPINCSSFGMAQISNTACKKKVIASSKLPSKNCKSNLNQFNQICYADCAPGYTSLWQICWQMSNPLLHNCGILSQSMNCTLNYVPISETNPIIKVLNILALALQPYNFSHLQINQTSAEIQRLKSHVESIKTMEPYLIQPLVNVVKSVASKNFTEESIIVINITQYFSRNFSQQILSKTQDYLYFFLSLAHILQNQAISQLTSTFYKKCQKINLQTIVSNSTSSTELSTDPTVPVSTNPIDPSLQSQPQLIDPSLTTSIPTV